MKQLWVTSRRRAGSLVTAFTVLAILFTVSPSSPGEASATTGGVISGTVFRDYDANGTQGTTEPGQGGIDVSVTCVSDSGPDNVIGTADDVYGSPVTTTSAANGSWSVTTTGSPCRVDFSIPAALNYLQAGAAGGTSVQFVNSPSAGVNFGVNNPADYCQLNPTVATTCFEYGPVTGTNSAEAAVRTFPNTATGDYPANGGVSAATFGQVGAVWGLAPDQATGGWYASAYIKSNSGLAGAPGAIYVIPPAGSAAAPTTLVTLPAGTDPHPANNATNATWLRDANTWDEVGKEGIGDIQTSEDGKTLYAVNLFDRQLYSIPVATPASYTSVAIPDPAGCAASDWRPFGLGVHDDRVYVGGVCSNQSTDVVDSNFAGYVYEANAAVTSFTSILKIPFDGTSYPRKCADGTTAGTSNTSFADNTNDPTGICKAAALESTNNADWSPWDSATPPTTFAGTSTPRHETPELTSIAFTADGGMAIGLRSRFGDQIGNGTYAPGGNSTTTYGAIGLGDLLKACQSSGTWTLESDGSCGGETGGGPGNLEGPGGGEFFNGDDHYYHDQIDVGGVATIKTSDQVVTSMFDPLPAQAETNDGGVTWQSGTTGIRNQAYRIYNGAGNNNATFGKANGLGDLEVLCNLAPIELGNRVWLDANGNGQQDPGEKPISGVTVQLWSGNTQIGTTTTDASGDYVFGGVSNQSMTGGNTVAADTTYQIRIPNATGASQQAPLAGYELAPANQGAADTDSNGVLSGTTDVATVLTGAAGGNDHTLDFGFMPIPPLVPSIEIEKWSTDDGPVAGDYNTAPGKLLAANTPESLTFTITNNGTDPLDNIAVTDSLSTGPDVTGLSCDFSGVGGPASGTTWAGPLAAAASFNCTATVPGMVPATQHTDTATVTATGATTSTPVTASDPWNGYTSPVPSVSIHKYSTDEGYPAGEHTTAPGKQLTTGVAEPLTFTITNTGSDALDNVAVTDVSTSGPDVTGLTCDFSGLGGPESGTTWAGPFAVGATFNCSATVPAMAASTQHTDVATVTGTGDITKTPVTSSDDWNGFTPAPARYAIGDSVWLDSNGNGIQDLDEPIVPGVTVTLKDAGGATIATTTTDNQGEYHFDNLLAGTYSVVFTAPPGDVFTTENAQGSTPGDDSNADASGATTQFDLGPSDVNVRPSVPADDVTAPNIDRTIDAGLVPATYAIGDYVWMDTNANGIQDNGEPAVPGVTVTLKDNVGNVVATTTTDSNGAYHFDNLLAGTYTVVFTAPAGDLFTTENATGSTVDNDSNADSTGVTATIDLGPSDPNVAPSTGLDLVTAPFIDRTIDAGLVPATYAIGDYVWMDTNANGIQDNGEPAVPGVTVTLKDNVGNVVATTTTDSNGAYHFDNLLAGTYTVVFTAPAGDLFTTENATGSTAGNDSNADSTGVTATIDLGPSDPNVTPSAGFDLVTAPFIDRTIDAGLVPATYAIGDYVWMDTNGNGIQDNGEPAVPGVTVTLKDNVGNVVATTTTDSNGAYHFDNLLAGTYTVVFTAPAGDLFTTENATGSTATNDSNADSTGTTATIVLGPTGPNVTPSDAGDNVTAPFIDRTIDAGLVPATFAIGDYVWMDTNANGIQDNGEPAVPGVTVTLKDNVGNVVATTTTDSNGAYHFDNLPAGTYTVVFSAPAGDLFTTENATGSTVDNDSNADSTGTTATIVLGPTGPNVTPSDAGDNVTAPFIDRTIDAGLVPATYAIGDYVWMDTNANGIQDNGEPAVPGVTVTLKDSGGSTIATTTTDSNGAYHFDNLLAGTYTVVFTAPAGDLFTTENATGSTAGNDSNADSTGTTGTIVLGPTGPNVTPSVAGDNVTARFIDRTIDAGLVPATYAIGDYVWMDTNANGIQDNGEPAVPGVTVTLKDSGGSTIATTTTDSNGAYHFDNLPAGTYTVVFSAPAGDLFTTENATGSTVTNDSNADSTGTTATIVLGPSGPNVTPSDAGDNVTAPFIDRTIDAGLVPATYAIGDYVWMDTNANGIQDNGEPPVPGVTVTLKDSGGSTVATTTTDSNGAYHFDNLLAGTYTVVFTAPAGDLFTTQNATGSTVDNDSNADSTGVTATIDLGPSDPNVAPSTGLDLVTAPFIDRTIDAGLVPATYAVGDHVWMDTNGNGIQDNGEPAVPGVTVTLKDNVGNVMATTTTDSNGAYHFDNLLAGTYTVVFTAPAGDLFTTENATGSTVDNDSNADSTGTTATIVLGPTGPNVTPSVAGDNVTAPFIDRTIDAGLVPATYAIGDYVWMDTNGNGIQDNGEPGVPGVTVTLKDSGGSTVATTTTDSNGAYHFDNLLAGTYTVVFSAPAGDLFTTQNATGSTVDNDSNVDSTGVTATIDLGPSDPNVAPSTGLDLVTAPFIDRTIDAGLVPATYAIGDYVWMDTNGNGIQDNGEPAVPGVTVTLKDNVGNVLATTTTDSNGAYHFDNLLAGTYTVVFTAPAGDLFTTENATGSTATNDSNADSSGSTTIDLGPGDPNVTPSAGFDLVTAPFIDRTIDAGLVPATYAIGDYVWMDTNANGIQDNGEPAVPGVTVTLEDSGGSTVATTTTDSNGAYHFDNLPAGTYTVVFTAPAGDLFTTENATGSTVDNDSNADSTGVTATIVLGPTGPNVTPSDAGDNVTAPFIDHTIDAGLVPATYAIGDYVWFDTNGNGIQDNGEPAVVGVTVTLEDSGGSTIATTTTDDNGAYHFDNLPAGTYTVVFTAPAGDLFTTENATSSTVDNDSNADSTGTTATIDLGPSDPNVTASAGLDLVTAPFIDRTIDAGLVSPPPNPSLRVEKYDGDVSFTPNPNVSTADKATDAPDGDANTPADAIVSPAGEATPVNITLNNNGDVPLYDVTVSDQTIDGTGDISGLSCTFPDQSTGLYFAGPLAVGAVVNCTGSLPGLGDSATHEDEATVFGRSGVIINGVGSPDPSDPPTGQPITATGPGIVTDTDPFNVVTPTPPPPPTTTTTEPTTTTTTQPTTTTTEPTTTTTEPTTTTTTEPITTTTSTTTTTTTVPPTTTTTVPPTTTTSTTTTSTTEPTTTTTSTTAPTTTTTSTSTSTTTLPVTTTTTGTGTDASHTTTLPVEPLPTLPALPGASNLARTGEALSSLAAFGLGMIVVGFMLVRRRRRTAD